MKSHLLLYLALAVPFGGAWAAEPVTRTEHLVVYKTEDTFANVRENLELAITDRGLVINNVSYIGKMLARTGKDLGADKQVYTDAQSLEFCSATVSRHTMEADPANIVFCPYIISIYTLPAEPKAVYLAYRRPPPAGGAASRAALKEIESLLDGIVQGALKW